MKNLLWGVTEEFPLLWRTDDNSRLIVCLICFVEMQKGKSSEKKEEKKAENRKRKFLRLELFRYVLIPIVFINNS
jgi:hypothetical protein